MLQARSRELRHSSRSSREDEERNVTKTERGVLR